MLKFQANAFRSMKMYIIGKHFLMKVNKNKYKAKNKTIFFIQQIDTNA